MSIDFFFFIFFPCKDIECMHSFLTSLQKSSHYIEFLFEIKFPILKSSGRNSSYDIYVNKCN